MKVLQLDEIKILIEDAYDNLESSILLYKNGKFRNSIALSYYTMFLAAKALLIKKSIYPKTHNGTLHKFIEEYVHKDHFDSELAKNFLRTQNLREHASY